MHAFGRDARKNEVGQGGMGLLLLMPAHASFCSFRTVNSKSESSLQHQ